MDSLTQIVLGASVAEATLGKKIGNKAILLGAIAGTIPDLDIVARFFVDDLSASVPENMWFKFQKVFSCRRLSFGDMLFCQK